MRTSIDGPLFSFYRQPHLPAVLTAAAYRSTLFARKLAKSWRDCAKMGSGFVATRGSHRQFKHPEKPGRVTVAGKPNHNLALGTLDSIMKQARLKQDWHMKYAVVIENAGNNYSAYVPDLPGCIATGVTFDKAEAQIREAIELHRAGLLEKGMPVPPPTSQVEYIEIAA